MAAVLAVVALTPFLSSCDTTLPLGGARNFLGTGSLAGFGWPSENFMLSVGGYCSRREFGEQLLAHADNEGGLSGTSWGAANDTPGHSCQPADEGGPSYVRHNPDENSAGYAFEIDIPDGAIGPFSFQIYDPTECTNPTGTQQTAYRLTHIYGGSGEIASRTFSRPNGDCTAANGLDSWLTFATLGNGPARYRLEVTAPPPTSLTTSETNNQFALRVAQPAGFSACTNDPYLAVPGVPNAVGCPMIRALGATGRYLTVASGSPTYDLATVGAEHAGKTLQVEFFDLAEGATKLELLDPHGYQVWFTADIACQDGTYLRDLGTTACTTGELPPTVSGGKTYGPWSGTSFDLCGPIVACGRNGVNGDGPGASAEQPWGFPHLVQRTQYSNRTIRLRVLIPPDAPIRYSGWTLWRFRLTNPTAAFIDRTTVTVSIV